jgi:outer membrane lipopolysaccharide assembly protein LptE/RlpB
MRKLVAILTVALGALASGCGYHQAGHADHLPADVHTVAVPAFVNQTQSYRLEQLLTAAVVREFTTRTQYRVTSQPDESSDAVLRGVVTSAQFAPLTYDSQSGRASSGLVTVNLRVQLLDRKGKVLWENQNYVFREEYQISSDVNSFFEEDSPALERATRDFARTLVSNILENY